MFSGAGSYHEVIGKGTKQLKEVATWLTQVKEEGKTFNIPRKLYKQRSTFVG